jgi:outer membrane protein assembly factor BamB
MTSPALAGIAATRKYVIVADRGETDQTDLWRCVHADSGRLLWKLEYRASGRLEYGNSPRATPLIHMGNVYLLGAFGDLHCVRLSDGNVLWKRNIVLDFWAKQLVWGVCNSPLILDDKLFVCPGGSKASVAALDPATGKTIWQTPGRPAAYASFIAGTFGGRRQLVGYDSTTLGGWDIATGKRLWELVPEEEGDFNTPTPIGVDGRLVVSSEQNGTRLYDFAEDGTIKPEFLGQDYGLAPDTSTPVAVGGKVYGCWAGELFCLSLGGAGDCEPLEAVWIAEDRAFRDHVSLFASRDRLLIASCPGELLLVDTAADDYELIGRLSMFGSDCELMSHPALVGTRLYARDGTQLLCLELGQD